MKTKLPLLLIALLSAFSAANASAEDVTPEDWNGVYAGINAGINATQNQVSQTGFASSTGNAAQKDLAAATARSLTFGNTSNSASQGFGGLTLGYSKIVNDDKNLLLGAEADIMFGGGSNSNNVTQSSYSSLYPATASQTTNTSTQMNWLSTIRARLGFLPDPSLLLYVTGGLALGNVNSTTNIRGTTGDDHGGTEKYTSSNSASGTNSGWTAGLGAEYRFQKEWSVKGEWLYYDLGSVSSSANGKNSAGGFPNHLNSLSTSTKTAFSGNIFRLGLNYRF